LAARYYRLIKHVPLDTDHCTKAFLVNATSIYFVTAAFLPLLSKSISSPTGKMGSVINTTSNSGQLRM
jgi:NAD(P)-dependent dehydrogenase (short-subunit alcohol dehydrogenase family)